MKSVVRHVLMTVAVFTGVQGLLHALLSSPFDNDGAHILAMLQLKLFPRWATHKVKNFHTQLYLCMPEFDFMSLQEIYETLWNSNGVFILMTFVLLSGTVINSFWKRKFQPIGKNNEKTVASKPILPEIESRDSQISFVLIFYIIQTVIFSFMAVLFMRLRVFAVPHLCLLLALLCRASWPRLFPADTTKKQSSSSSDRQTSNWSILGSTLRLGLLSLVLSILARHMVSVIPQRMDMKNEFEDHDLEITVDWFRRLPPKEKGGVVQAAPWVISGSMSTMAMYRQALVVSSPPSHPGQPSLTKFAITNHPHYENANLRRRTPLTYTIYSRNSVEQVWHIYHNQLKADFISVEYYWCLPKSMNPCSIAPIFDMIQPQFANQPSLCSMLNLNSNPKPSKKISLEPYFTEVFATLERKRVVLKVNDLSRV